MTKVAWMAVLSLAVIGLCSCQSFERQVSVPVAQHAVDRVQWPDGEANIDTARRPLSEVLPSPSPGVVPAAYTAQSPGPMPASGVIQTAAARPIEPEGNPVQLFPDEYLFDGGDRAKPIHFDDFRRLGLDTEDTIAEYSDHTGKRKIAPSNRIAVYSPRFAAVRTIGQPEQGVGGNRAVSMLLGSKPGGVDGRLAPLNHKGRSVPDAVRVRARGSGIDADRKAAHSQSTVAVASHGLNTRALENLAIIRNGQFDRTQEAVLATGIQATVTWTKPRFPVVVGTTQQSGEVSARFNPSEYIGREDMRKTTGKLRIVKVADKETARPGEVVTFTIRYDNLGDRALHHIRILDNLTPRLEYVKDSADSDRAGRLVVEENHEGSLVLKFEVTDPLPGHKGGVVKFQAKVR